MSLHVYITRRGFHATATHVMALMVKDWMAQNLVADRMKEKASWGRWARLLADLGEH